MRRDFYPRSPCGERRVSCVINNVIDDFYPRSPCGERLSLAFGVFLTCIFLSTLSLRRATRFHAADISARRISIHALLAESDPRNWQKPHGQKKFLSTLSLRRATLTSVVSSAGTMDFYPRSPCGERPDKHVPPPTQPNFYPRSPCGERRWPRAMILLCLYFYPRSPCGERPGVLAHHARKIVEFLSTLSLRRATSDR